MNVATFAHFCYFWLKLWVQSVLLFVSAHTLLLPVSYGCCRDGVTAAQGPNKEGCMEYVAPAPTVSKHTRNSICSEEEMDCNEDLPRMKTLENSSIISSQCILHNLA